MATGARDCVLKGMQPILRPSPRAAQLPRPVHPRLPRFSGVPERIQEKGAEAILAEGNPLVWVSWPRGSEGRSTDSAQGDSHRPKTRKARAEVLGFELLGFVSARDEVGLGLRFCSTRPVFISRYAPCKCPLNSIVFQLARASSPSCSLVVRFLFCRVFFDPLALIEDTVSRMCCYCSSSPVGTRTNGKAKERLLGDTVQSSHAGPKQRYVQGLADSQVLSASGNSMQL